MGKGFDSRKPKHKDYRTFLDKVLKTIKRTNWNRQAVERLLRANLDKLDDKFAQVVRNWAAAILSQEEPEQVQYIAAVISFFSNLIQQFPLGNRANNLEIAITGYEVAVTVFTRQAFPQFWAACQNDLGAAYRDRIRGDRAENLEVAIRYYLDALEIRTREAFPEQWAETQNNLGEAYRDRIRGEKAENLELAIRYYFAALEVHTRETFPQDWADIQNNLGLAYLDRIRGERAENLEAAIEYCLAALKEYSRENFPQDWAVTQNNLGEAYRDRIRGEKAENLETAIHCYLAVLEVHTREAFPQYWAGIQNNLGIVYADRLRGERAENLEAAIRYYLAALDVYTREAFPQYWAETQSNLGNAYFDRIRGERAENLEAAIRYYLAALEVSTREAFPQLWAGFQINLGNAYRQRIFGEKTKNLKQAICHYLAALEVRTRQSFPQGHLEAQFSLGFVYQEAQQFANAYTAFEAAIDILESLRGEIVSGYGREEDKQKLAEEWNQLYQGMVEVCLTLGNTTEAIEYAERSKTRNLVELILTRDLYSIFALEIVNQLEQLRDEISSGQYQLQSATADNPTALTQHLQQLRQQRNELQDRYLPIGHGFKVDQFQKTLDEHTAIIQWYITRSGFETFIITRHNLQRLILSTPAGELNDLINWANEYLEAYTQKKTQWINSLGSRISRLAEILHLEDILKLVPDTCSRLILIPHRYLHLFPLHTLPLANGDFLCDRFPNGVGYAPSCQLLQLAQKRERPDFSNLFAIQNPTDDLLYSNLEVEVIRSSFCSTQILLKQAATKTALKANQDLPSVHCTHFSCHGTFNLASPLESALILANNERITLGEIFALTLNQSRLVTLSACETGLSDPNSLSDEYISLPSGFLYAGTPSIVSSLWAVSDLSTSFLMIKFYENLRNYPKLEAGDVAIALNKAQKWLRNLTCKGFEQEWAKPHYQQAITQIKQKLSPGEFFEWEDEIERQRQRLQKLDPNHKPFANPYYWAAFIATGI